MPQHLLNKILSRPKNNIIRNSNHTDYIAYNVNVVADGNKLNATYKEKGTKNPRESIKIQNWMKEIFPINTRHSMLTKMVNMYMGSSFQGQCSVQSNRVTTFDQVEYNYSMNDCEHVVVIEKSQRPGLLVTVKTNHTDYQVHLHVRNLNRYSKFSNHV